MKSNLFPFLKKPPPKRKNIGRDFFKNAGGVTKRSDLFFLVGGILDKFIIIFFSSIEQLFSS